MCLIQKRIQHNLSSRFAIFASSVSILSKKYKQLKFILLHHNITISFIYTDWLMSLSLYLGSACACEPRPQEGIVCQVFAYLCSMLKYILYMLSLF